MVLKKRILKLKKRDFEIGDLVVHKQMSWSCGIVIDYETEKFITVKWFKPDDLAERDFWSGKGLASYYADPKRSMISRLDH